MRFMLLFTFMAILYGCDSLFPITASNICEEHEQFCSDLNPDGWCQAQKSQIIKHRYQYELAPTELLDYYLLKDFEAYKVCITKAAQVVHIIHKEKKIRRMQAVVVAEQELNRLARKTRNSSEPHLLLYHWSRFGDKEALRKFMALEAQHKLNTASLQLALASYYVKFNQAKAKKALYKAIELTSVDAEMESEIFSSLSTINMKQDNFKEAYIWAYVAKNFAVADIDLQKIVPGLKPVDQVHELEKIAEHYIDQIHNREFKGPV
ncbi:MAG: hypothetical protein ACI9C4_000092 [Paraglaciecola sp.]|jgi:hypothetical protein